MIWVLQAYMAGGYSLYIVTYCWTIFSAGGVAEKVEWVKKKKHKTNKHGNTSLAMCKLLHLSLLLANLKDTRAGGVAGKVEEVKTHQKH